MVTILSFVVAGKKVHSGKSSSSSQVSARDMEDILIRLRTHTTRSSTAKNYYSIWKKFNNFILILDSVPTNWEHRVSLYGAYLVDNGMQSQTLKSYLSAIKKVLSYDGYDLKMDLVLLNTLTKACKIVNDTVNTRLPI